MSSEGMTFEQMIASAQEAGGSLDAPPAGTYQGVVVSANTKRNGKGKLTIGLLLRVTQEGDSKGLGLWSNQYLSPENATALGIWFRTFEALGIPTAWWAQFADLDQAAAQAATAVKGKECTFTVQYGEWQGEMRAEVKSIKKAAAGTGTIPAQALPVSAPAPVAPLAPVAPAPAAPSAAVPAPPTSPF